MSHETLVRCPICHRLYDQTEIEEHIAKAHPEVKP